MERYQVQAENGMLWIVWAANAEEACKMVAREEDGMYSLKELTAYAF